MILKERNYQYLVILIIAIYAFFINWISANVGAMPIDTFGFLDTGYSILKNKLPIRDFWIFTGITVDYLEALFLLIFGNYWSSHVTHASIINIIASLSFYFFLNEINLKKSFSFFYSISFATLCYPVSGTPFAYLHSYILSIILIFLLFVGIKNKSNLIWFIIPIISFLAFLSMQTPSAYIILLAIFFSIYYFVKEKKIDNIKFAIFGSITSLILFFLYLIITNTPFKSFLYQYILFPLTIGEGRITSGNAAYVSLIDQLNFKTLIGNFKFIHIFFFPLIIATITIFIKKKKSDIKVLNLLIILSTLIFLFNQLVTANQIYIFSLIPILASILHLNILQQKYSPKLIFVIFIILIFATAKFHFRYNVDRKFHDLEKVNKSLALNAELISKNLKNLKWITPHYKNPKEEIDVIKKALDVLENDKRSKSLITHYQFFSTILDQDLNIFNRWYLWDNNTHPTESHKYFNFYKNMVNENIEKNNIKVIYLLGSEKEILFVNVKNYFTDKCFKSTTLVKDKFSMHEIINCKK